MSEDKRNIVTLEKRRRITENELDTAFAECDGVFWEKALTFFPEVKSGDTDPAFTGYYTETVKAFMRHWLSINGQLTVGEHCTELRAREMVLLEMDRHNSWRQHNDLYTIATLDTVDEVTLRVVELEYDGKPQGYGVKVEDVAGGHSDVAIDETELTQTVQIAISAVEGRIGQ